MLHKIKNVEPEAEYILLILFADGTQKKYDIKPLFDKWPKFNDLKNISGLYDLVKVDLGGYGISWNDEIDLSADELYKNGNENAKNA